MGAYTLTPHATPMSRSFLDTGTNTPIKQYVVCSIAHLTYSGNNTFGNWSSGQEHVNLDAKMKKADKNVAPGTPFSGGPPPPRTTPSKYNLVIQGNQAPFALFDPPN